MVGIDPASKKPHVGMEAEKMGNKEEVWRCRWQSPDCYHLRT
jgi:hypothetical protein